VLSVLDLFSGIGGFSYGLELAGDFRTIAFCEREPALRQLLAERWPGVPIHGDVTKLDGSQYRGLVDVLCGGFPCQPASVAGKRLGAEDDRWLWPDMLRVVEESEPTWVVGENVAGLDGLGLDEAIDGLEAAGYEVAPPLEIPAYAVGADHERFRIWIIAYSERYRLQGRQVEAAEGPRQPRAEQLPGLLFPRIRDALSAARVWRADHGIPTRMDVRRNMAVGNAIVPQIAQAIGEAILEAEGA
jgi:DNA (cytosine-5)-methyltransferase 1